MSKQLIIGLMMGALSTGLVFSLMSKGPELPQTSSEHLSLLAQVIPNEPVTEIEPSDEDVIEVRVAPVPKATVKTVATAITEDEEEFLEDESVAEVIAFCEYESGDKPKREGIISEVAWMGTGDDANAEWVELQNRTKGELDVSGWQLIDKAQQIQARVPAGVVLPRSGFLLFERDESQLQGESIIYKGALGNADEGVRLFTDDCELQDEVVAGSRWPAGTNKPKHTAERAKDLSWHTFFGDADAGVFGTPGKKNSSGPPPESEPLTPQEDPEPEEHSQASSTPDVVEKEPEAVHVSAGQLIIAELVAGTASGAGDEFIELYNVTDAEIDLTGFSIKKKVLASGNESSLVTTVNFEGKKIGAGERFIIGHGGYADISQMSWPTSYSVAYTGNAALLYNAQGEKIDEVSWELSAGQSYACVSQGSCAVQEVPNPGA